MGPAPKSTPDYSKAKNVKELFDMIGEIVQKKVTRKAIQYNNDLHGVLSNVNFSNNEKINTTNACLLDHNKHTTVSWNVTHPCDRRSKERFSDDGRSQCSTSRITGNNSNTGACAPYRKLQLCDYNLERITDTNTTNTHNLLVDVLLAAKYEGQSITQDYPKYQAQYASSFSTSQICTMLARSFADIGDIIRGKDLYVGNRKEREKEELQKNLKTIFKKIYDNLVQNKKDAKGRYGGDDNYYQLREDWWDANRQEVWKAITCHAGESDKYFRNTCGSGNNASPTQGKCRCKTNVVPTYFDYVPQYLRWFEEWAEDFCRKRKYKLKDAIKKCREGKDQSGGERYCDLNGYDCKGTFSAKKKYRWDHKCTGCFLSCSHFRTWIDNQKLEFEKQKEKYTNEINKKHDETTIKIGNTTINNLYVKEFYEKLKEDYGGVNAFLGLLSKEQICKDPPQASEKTADTADFTEKNYVKTFSHTEYCQACPLCGVEKQNGTWERKDSMKDCPRIKLYKPKSDEVGTPINFLYSGDEPTEIGKKLKKFCDQINRDNNNGEGAAAAGGRGGSKSDSQELYQEWKCYQIGDLTNDGQDGEDDPVYEADVKNAGGLCILKKKKEGSDSKSQNDPAEIQKTFNPFFYYWVVHMLKDSIHWRTKKIKSCINNTNESKACKNNNKCNSDCGCFEKWVEHKEQEWMAIKDHFGKQEGMREQIGGADTGIILEGVLDKEVLLESLQEAYGKAEDIKHIKDLLKEEEAAGGVPGTEQKNIMDKLLQHEKGIAKNCIQKHTCPPQEDKSRGRSDDSHDPPPASPTAGTSSPRPPGSDDELDDEEDDEDGADVGDGAEVQEPAEGTHGEGATEEGEGKTATGEELPVPTTDTTEKVCKIVEELFTNGDTALKEACGLKYGPGGKENFPNWKCIPSGKPGDTAATTTSGKSGGDKDGAICVPPRRRKLYLGGFKRLTDGTAVSSEATPATSSRAPKGDPLLTAFVESAAVETFFLWHRYKKEWEQRNKKPQEGSQLLQLDGSSDTLGDSGDPEPQNQLASGTIPLPFLRQMFYTLGDYRDILVRGGSNTNGDTKDGGDNSNNNNIVLLASGKENKEAMKKIQDKIKSVIEKSDDTPRTSPGPPQTSDEKRKDWWDNNAEHIWKGMVCALTYDTNTTSGQTPTQDEKVKGQLLESDGKKPKETKYKYDQVKLEDESGPKASNEDTLNNPKLKDFVKLPPFFRWLHEWGSDFCGKRARMLKNVRKGCREKASGGYTYCGGDGHDCTENGQLRHKNMSADPDCRPCYEQCRKYKKWIDIKFAEFEKQKDKYGEEHEKLKTNSNGDNNCCTEIKEKTSAAQFLKALKHCKDNQGNSGEKGNELIFTNTKTTFGPLDYCKTCPPNKVNCRTRSRTGTNPCTPDNGNGNTWKELFNKISKDAPNKTTTIDVQMIDRRWPFIEEYMEKNSKNSEESNNSLFKDSYLFKGLRVQNWECKFENVKKDVCYLKNFNPEIDLNEYTTFKVLLIYWLEDFLYGYYLLKKRKIIEKCTKKEGNTCDANYKNDCACVKEWIGKKRGEWETIRGRFNEQYKNETSGDYNVRSFLETFLVQIGAAYGEDKFIKLSKFDNSCACSADVNKQKNDDNQDVIECMLKKLEEKIKTQSCPPQASDDTQAACVEKSPNVEDDDEEPLEEENQNPEDAKKMMPTFCDIEDEKPKENEGTCEEAKPPRTVPEKEKEKKTTEEEATVPAGTAGPKPKPEPEAKPPTKPQRPQPPSQPPTPPQVEENPFDHPLLKTALVTSTLAWSVGIGFAAFTYFYLKVLYIYINIYGCGCI